MYARRCLEAASVGALLSVTSAAGAQNGAASEALFNRGLEQMEAGEYEAGCPAIGESYRLDPRPGTLFTLAECEFKRGRLATAYERYGDYLTLFDSLPPEKRARQQGRDKISRDQRAALGPRLPLLALVLAPGLPREAIVKRDGVVLAEPALGVGLPIDPGEHVLSVQLPGRPPFERRVRIDPGEKKQVLLEDKAPPERALPPLVVAPLPIPEVSPAPSSGPSGRRIAAYSLGSVGVAGIVVGSVLGGLTLSKKSVVDAHCGIAIGQTNPGACTHEGTLAGNSAKALGAGSTAGFALGAAALAAGVVLFVIDARSGREGNPRATGSTWMSAGVVEAGRSGAVLGLWGGL